MTEQELYNILSQVQVSGSPIKVYYDHFEPTPTNPTITPPFILYRLQDINTLVASGIVWDKENNFIIDLCCELKDVSLENQIENLFEQNEIIFDKEENYISSESMYQIRYFI